ncbi:hypothetical protein [Tenacibaculum sp. UWU-22]|uniref:hypothetical protein n=1 Tax=Tenacibaculum sp. UWU-22 TaxID=3234187 RepID=UPI0034DB6F3C
MEKLNQIIEILSNHLGNEDLFDKIGNIKNRVGNNLVFDSKIDGVLGILLVLNDDKISKVKFVLKDAIYFEELMERFGSYQLSYNHYEEKSVIVFQISNDTKLIAEKDRYIINDEILISSFNEFEIVKE